MEDEKPKSIDQSKDGNEVDPKTSEYHEILDLNNPVKDDSWSTFIINCKGCKKPFPFKSIQKHIFSSQVFDCLDSYDKADIECLRFKAYDIKTFRDKEWKMKNKAHVKTMEDQRYQVKKRKREEEYNARIEAGKEEEKAQNEKYKTEQAQEAMESNKKLRDGILRFMERIASKFKSNEKFDANSEQFQQLRGIVNNSYDKIVKNIEDVVVRANHEVELEDIGRVFDEILHGKENQDSTDIFYMWERIEGVVIRKLKIIADSLGEPLPCYACNAKCFNVPNCPEKFCENSIQYKPHSETKCVKGVLQWAKKLSTVKNCLFE